MLAGSAAWPHEARPGKGGGLGQVVACPGQAAVVGHADLPAAVARPGTVATISAKVSKAVSSQ